MQSQSFKDRKIVIHLEGFIIKSLLSCYNHIIIINASIAVFYSVKVKPFNNKTTYSTRITLKRQNWFLDSIKIKHDIFSLNSLSLLTFNFSISYGDMDLFDSLYEHGLPQLMSLNGIWAFKFSIPRCSILLHGSTFTMNSKVELMRGESIQQVTLVQVWSRLQVSGD